MRTRLALLSSVAVALIALGSAPARAQVVINEVDYDQPNVDTAEFIELYNGGGAAVSLATFRLELVNGSGGGAQSYRTLALPAVSLAPGAFFVVCANPATVAGCDLDAAPDTDLIQNGAPDAIALFDGDTLVDSLSYEGAVPGFGEGPGAVADTGGIAEGLSRCADGADTQSNAADFGLRPITPGAANHCPDPLPGIGACGHVHDQALPGEYSV